MIFDPTLPVLHNFINSRFLDKLFVIGRPFNAKLFELGLSRHFELRINLIEEFWL
jgi:hypothetical protein